MYNINYIFLLSFLAFIQGFWPGIFWNRKGIAKTRISGINHNAQWTGINWNKSRNIYPTKTGTFNPFIFVLLVGIIFDLDPFVPSLIYLFVKVTSKIPKKNGRENSVPILKRAGKMLSRNLGHIFFLRKIVFTNRIFPFSVSKCFFVLFDIRAAYFTPPPPLWIDYVDVWWHDPISKM